MQPRDPDTLESVVQEMLEVLGRQRMMAVTGLSKTMIYNAANPDMSHRLEIKHLVKLDRVCAQHDSVTPFTTWVRRQVDKDEPDDAENGCVFAAALSLSEAVGVLSGAVRDAKSADSPGGRRIVRREALAIKDLSKKTRTVLDLIDRVVDAEQGGEGYIGVIEDLAAKRGGQGR